MSDNSPQLKDPADLVTWSYNVIRRHMKRLVIVFFVTAILSVTVSLLMPVWYKSTARLMPPESSGLGGGLTSMLSNISPAASRLLGSSSSSNNYDRYLAILTSDSIMDAVIEEFDLMTVYKTQNHAWPRYETRHKLRKNFSFHIDEKYDFLLVSVEDRDPQRAADMTNFFVEELNRRNSELLAQEAHRFRTYVEKRYNEVIADLDAAQNDLQRLQEELGIVELPATIEALMVGMAGQGAEMLEADMQYNMLLSQYGPNNPQVQAARAAVDAARRAEQEFLQGAHALLPVSMDELPKALNRYATAYRNVLLQGELLTIAQPMYEQARFDEEREKVAVQVIDTAETPERKSRPKRAYIVLGAVFSVMAIYLTFILASARMEMVRRERISENNA